MPALTDEVGRERHVAVERGPAAGPLVDDLELELGPLLLVVREQRGSLEGELTEGVMQRTIPHAGEFAGSAECPARRGGC
jgi:hypothetical protein